METKEYMCPKVDVIDLELEDGILTRSGDEAGFGEPTDEDIE